MRTDVDRLSAAELRASRDAWWSEDFDDFLVAAAGEVGTGRVLDVGCGLGDFERRLAPRFPAATRFVGVDIDLSRLGKATREAATLTSRRAVSWCAADALALPFREGTFVAAVAILALQHAPDPLRVLREMRRVVARGGTVLAVEADNPGQRLYLPGASRSLDEAVAAFWRRIDDARPPENRAVGPRLPALFRQAGCEAPAIRGFLVTRASRGEPEALLAGAREQLERIAGAHGLGESSELRALMEVLAREVVGGPAPFYMLVTVPLFAVTARL